MRLAQQGRAEQLGELACQVTFQQAQFPNPLLQSAVRIRNWEGARSDKLGQRMTERIVTVHQKVVLEAQSTGVFLW